MDNNFTMEFVKESVKVTATFWREFACLQVASVDMLITEMEVAFDQMI
jgi:hypothetical protein